MAESQSHLPRPKHKKLPRLPDNAKVEKRPLLRPAIPSPYAGASQQKIVYISTHTPFLSAVKRVEKLLHLADKRLVQSATANAGKDPRGAKRKRGGHRDEILDIAEEVERAKSQKRRKGAADGAGGDDEGNAAGEEVVLKGTGKAIHRVLELALWFQQREQEYTVRLETGTVGAIDDISIEDGTSTREHDGKPEQVEDAAGGAQVEPDAMEIGQIVTESADKAQDVRAEGTKAKKKDKCQAVGRDQESNEVQETRIRYVSVLEVYVSLR